MKSLRENREPLSNEPAPLRAIADDADSHWATALLLPGVCIVLVATLCVSFNGGISIGDSNHTGLLPVVRRLLDPNYLPGDFSISLRLYHHRVFAWLIVGLTKLLGEERSLITLHVAGALLLAWSLWLLCRTLKLSWLSYLVAGMMLATGFLWTGRGLEENDFIGNPEVQPPLFAHSFVLLCATFLLRERWRLAAFCAGLAVLFHLQIGVTCTLMIAPLYLFRLRQFGRLEVLRLAASYLLPASMAVLHLLQMMQRGLLHHSASEYSLAMYIDFRHPHHFALMSAPHALWVSGHLLLMGALWYRLRREQHYTALLIGKLLALSLTLAGLALLHFTDYYLLRQDKLANLQMIRLSPVLTVFGTLCLLLVLKSGLQRSHKAWLPAVVQVCLLAVALGWGIYQARGADEENGFYFGVRRYANKPESWVGMCNWIRDHGPRDTVYLTPPARNGFTVLTNRSNVVEFKINPDAGLQLTEWFTRLKDLTGNRLPQKKGFENRKPLDQAYGELSEVQLIALGQKYRAGCAVLPATSKVQFETLHENKGFRLVRIPLPD